MMGKINITLIIKEHFSSLYIIKNEEKQTDYCAYIYLFILPLILTLIVLINWKTLCFKPINIDFYTIDKNLGQTLISFLSILSPLMFGFIPVIYSLIENSEINSDSKDFIKEFKSNVMFTMLLSFCTLGFLIIWSKFQNQVMLSSIIYYLVFTLGLHILMLIQRFNFLLNEFIKFKSK